MIKTLPRILEKPNMYILFSKLKLVSFDSLTWIVFQSLVQIHDEVDVLAILIPFLVFQNPIKSKMIDFRKIIEVMSHKPLSGNDSPF